MEQALFRKIEPFFFMCKSLVSKLVFAKRGFSLLDGKLRKIGSEKLEFEICLLIGFSFYMFMLNSRYNLRKWFLPRAVVVGRRSKSDVDSEFVLWFTAQKFKRVSVQSFVN